MRENCFQGIKLREMGRSFWHKEWQIRSSVLRKPCQKFSKYRLAKSSNNDNHEAKHFWKRQNVLESDEVIANDIFIGYDAIQSTSGAWEIKANKQKVFTVF